ncbi:olfactomedin-like protein 3A [Engraulis encrasicolus]|uniref:olfactomedin-like protein 3A n=1 Tax=Engraulis encrasicolus TaxID=184585 RepID=UPI002FD0ED04
MYIPMDQLATTVLLLSIGVSQSQMITQDLAMMQYFQARLIQLEERLISCEQNMQLYGQKIYDFSSRLHGHLSSVGALRADVKSQVEGVGLRVDRLERDMEYVQSKMPDQREVEVEDALLDQQVREAKELKKRVKLTLVNACGTALTEVKSMKIVKKSGDLHGSWMRDATSGSAQVYYFDGVLNDTVVEFPSVRAFHEANATHRPNANAIKLPHRWQGTGHVILNGSVYYHQAGTSNGIVKVELQSGKVTDSLLLPGAGRLPVYSLSPHTHLHLAADEMGLWVIHADPELGGNLVMTKLDSRSMHVEHSWDTHCRSQDAEAAFLICGTMYVVYNSHHGGRSSMRCVYDIHDSIVHEETPPLFFPKGYTSHASMHYYPLEKKLYSWDEGYQTIYKLDVKKKEAATRD